MTHFDKRSRYLLFRLRRVSNAGSEIPFLNTTKSYELCLLRPAREFNCPLYVEDCCEIPFVHCQCQSCSEITFSYREKN